MSDERLSFCHFMSCCYLFLLGGGKLILDRNQAIVERYIQIIYTLVETSISATYIHSLISLLHLKSSVRQRRVMLDLVYVNILNVAFDIITVILVYLNLLGPSHPIQTFSYIFKLRQEVYRS